MNILKTCAFCALLSVGLSQPAGAQAPAASEAASNRLFADLPDTILLDVSRLNGLLEQTTRSTARIEFCPQFSLQGVIVSAAHDDPQLTSLVLKASNRLGAVFTLSRIMENGKAIYSGRILSRNHADAFELVEADSRYYLVKRSHSDLVEE